MKTTSTQILASSAMLALCLALPTWAQMPSVAAPSSVHNSIPSSLPNGVRTHQIKADAQGLKDESRDPSTTAKPKPKPTTRKAAAKPAPKAATNAASKGSKSTTSEPTGPAIPEKTGIYHAAASGNVEAITKALAEHPSVTQQQDSSGLTPLHYASYAGQLEAVRLLVDSGSTLDVSGNRGETALLLAASKGQTEVVSFLAQSGADLNKAGSDGKTPLHKAAMAGHAATVEALIQAGASTQLQDRSGKTPLELAERYAQGDSAQVVRLLKKAAP